MNIKNFPEYLKLILGIKVNETLGFRLLTKIAEHLVPSYKFTWPELSWFRDPILNDVLKRFEESRGYNAHRRFALQQLLRLTLGIPGDTAECGVYKGCSSYIILQANQHAPFSRLHHVFDSFEGLSAPSQRDGGHWGVGDLSVGEEVARKNLSEFTGVKFYKGWIPSRFGEVADRSFSFVHIDVDLYEPTLESINFFYDRMNPGGIIVCDDYGFLTCPGATAAVDEFLLDKPEKMVFLSGGGGFLIKGCVTSPE